MPLEAGQIALPAVIPGSRRNVVSAEAAAMPGFAALLESFKPDVVHLHSRSVRCGLSHARAVKASVTCFKSTLIDASGAVCDGRLRETR